ncbi:hypothetical protein ACFU5O_02290 [Streptomyces sp. NPDC057445]|uniref:hypothetical protein n=1 Tax=Streptomyces sp. NPDC057445 TaxID=3346136 RepID=UPI0036D03C26
MLITARLLTGTSGPALAAAVCLGAFAAVPSAYAAEFEALQITPSSVSPGTTVTVTSTACGKGGHGTGDAQSIGAGEFKASPDKGKSVVVGRFKVPKGAKPGNYGIAMLCDNGKEATGDLVVRSHGQQPSGHVKTGVGGSVGPDTTQIAAGVVVMTAAAVGGAWLLCRRASGAQGS